ncbi:shikimate dehydrogenase [Dokdonia sp.]
MDKYGLIGRDIAYSFSRRYFASKFEKENINASYVNFDSKTIQDVEEYLSNPKIKGYNVTIPYKQSIIPFLDRLDAAALAIGAVNTIKRTKDGELVGYNTDHIGFRESLLEFCGDVLSKIDKESLSKQAIILGTGGASKGVAYALETLGFQIVYVSRSSEKGSVSYADLDITHITTSTIIVNCTPLGTFPNTQLCPEIPYNHLNSSHIVYDLIYNPEKTLFLEKANEQGAMIISGLRMLELQAEAAWDIWSKH